MCGLDSRPSRLIFLGHCPSRQTRQSTTGFLNRAILRFEFRSRSYFQFDIRIVNCQGNHNPRRDGHAKLLKEVTELNSELLDCIEINPSGRPTATLIWLHGLGADGHDFEAIVPELRLPESLSVRYVFPHAPERSITINAGLRMRAWFDVLDLK